MPPDASGLGEPLGDRVSLISGQHIEANACTTNPAHVPYLTGPADFPDGRIAVTKYTRLSKVMCESGDVLVTVKGSGTGKLVVADESYCISRQLMAVRARTCDPVYLYYLLASFSAGLRADASGLIPGISRSDLLGLQGRFPALPEQRRIAEILDTLDEGIRKTEQVITQLQQMKQGLLHDLLTRGIDDNGELRDPERYPEQFKDSPLGRMPKEWGVKSGEEVCNRIEVGIVIRPTQYYAAGGVPILRSANVRESGLDLSDLKFMSERDHRAMSKSAVETGDLVTVRTGYPGTTAVIPETLGTANCVDIIISRPGPLIDPQYLATWVNSDQGKGQVLRVQGGLAQQHFNVGEMKKLTVAVPTLAEQYRIVHIYGEVRNRIEREREQVWKLRTLKHGLMNDLLTGRVRVTVPEDAAA